MYENVNVMNKLQQQYKYFHMFLKNVNNVTLSFKKNILNNTFIVQTFFYRAILSLYDIYIYIPRCIIPSIGNTL